MVRISGLRLDISSVFLLCCQGQLRKNVNTWSIVEFLFWPPHPSAIKWSVSIPVKSVFISRRTPLGQTEPSFFIGSCVHMYANTWCQLATFLYLICMKMVLIKLMWIIGPLIGHSWVDLILLMIKHQCQKSFIGVCSYELWNSWYFFMNS